MQHVCHLGKLGMRVCQVTKLRHWVCKENSIALFYLKILWLNTYLHVLMTTNFNLTFIYLEQTRYNKHLAFLQTVLDERVLGRKEFILNSSRSNKRRTSLKQLSRRLFAICVVSPKWLDLSVSAPLDSSKLLFRNHSDVQWGKLGFFVEQVYQEVHGQLALALGSSFKTVMPAFYVIVGPNRPQEDRPTGWRPGVAFNPGTRYTVHELTQRRCGGVLL